MIKFGCTIVEVSPNPAYDAGQYINDLLSINITKPKLLLLAGGSARGVLSYINPEFITGNLTVSVTDERYTDDMGGNNFDILQTTEFYKNLMSIDASCINTSVVGGNIAFDDRSMDIGAGLHAQLFERNIREWKREFPDGIIIGLFGMGEDGHTSGIIPGIYFGKEFDDKFSGDSYIEVVNDPRSTAEFPWRITSTLTFMKSIDFPLFYIKGENKKSALLSALDQNTPYESVPARIMLDMKSPVIFTDISL